MKLSVAAIHCGTEQRVCANFEHESSAIGRGCAARHRLGAHANDTRHAGEYAESGRAQDVARRSSAWTGRPGVRAR